MPAASAKKPTPRLASPEIADRAFVTGRAVRTAAAPEEGVQKLSLRFPPELHRRAKVWAAEHGTNLNDMAIEGVRRVMGEG
jgi:predicted HicB family RNase H-like nuclease